MIPASRPGSHRAIGNPGAADTSSLLAEVRRLIDEPSQSDGGGNGDSREWQSRLQRRSSSAGRDETMQELADVDAQSFPLHIGRFELRSIVGSGGFGIVFRAYDPQLDRDVALKILRPEAALSPGIQRRFLREAMAAAQLEHAGIISVYEAGQQAGLNYLAAPLCDGPNLADWIREHQSELSPRQAAALIAQVADAVQHAHARGILHRDLKPSNIVLKAVTGDGRRETFQPLLTDFGLAGRLDQEGDETLQGMILGTTAYMSPEQAAGRWNDVGVASDVFSLGVILYELLVGSRPFAGSCAEEVRRNIISSDPAAPRRICRAVSPDLETVCLKCLSKQPQDRYLSAGDLAADLRRFLGHQPIHARPPGMAKQAWFFCRRRPLVAALTSLLALTLATSAAVTGALYRQERIERARAEEHLNFAREAVSKMYTKVADQWLVEQPEVQDLRREFLEDALRFYERIAAQKPHDERSRHDLSVALHRMANIAASLGRNEQTFQFRQRCLDMVDELCRDSPQNVAYQYDAFMNRLWIAGEGPFPVEQRLVILREAEAIIRRLLEAAPANPVYRDALAALCGSLASTHHGTGDLALAEKYWSESASVSEALRRDFPERLMYAKHAANAYACLALRRLEADQSEEAWTFFSQARQIIDDVRRQAPQARWPDEWAYVTLTSHAYAVADSGDAASAVPLLDDCRKTLSRLIAWYPKTPAFRAHRAFVCARLADAYGELDQRTDMLAALEMGENDAHSVLNQIAGEGTATQALQAIMEKKRTMTKD